MPVDKGQVIVLDFTNVREQSGFNPVHQEEGDYRGIIKDVTLDKAKSSENMVVTYAIGDTERPSAVYRYNCVLTEKSLWKLRNLFVAAGKQIPKKKLKLGADQFNSLIGKEIGMSLVDDEYEGKTRSQIAGVFPASELIDEEATPAPKKAAKKKAQDEDEAAPTPAEDDTEEELDELDIDEL
jgi:hypothetical protein